VDGFGEEWSRFDQTPALDELEAAFQLYFACFPWEQLPAGAVGFDAGCGSGRWARFVAPRAGQLHLVDASPKALEVAKRNCRELSNCTYHCASVADLPFADESMDFGYSLGVLHHVPDTAGALSACVRKLKPGAPFLVYLYYAFDNRPSYYRAIWRASDLLRQRVSKLPLRTKHLVAEVIAGMVYFPLARTALLAEWLGADPERIPLHAYRRFSFYTMRTDALDRFGTRLEQRFTRDDVRALMHDAGLERIRFVEDGAFWTAVGFKAAC